MLKITLRRAGIGFLLGMAVGNIIAVISAFSSTGEVRFMSQGLIDACGGEALAFLLQTVCSGLIGLAGFAGMSFYDIEHWSMLRTMLTHLAVVYAVFIPVSYLLYWIQEPLELLIMMIFMLVWYMIIWLIMCARYRAQVKKLNALQSEKLRNTNDKAA